MKLIKRIFVITLIACSFVGAGAPAVRAAPGTLVILCEDREDFPNVIGDGERINERRPGVAIEFVRLLGKKLKMNVVIKRMPWKRCLEIEIRQGRADGVIPISYRKEREEIGAYPMKNGKPDARYMFSVESYMFYKPKGSQIAWDGGIIRDFRGIVGAPPGYSVIDNILKMGLRLEEGYSLANMQKLVSGRIQLVAALEREGDHVLVTHPDLGRKIEKIRPPIVTKNYFLMLSHQFVNNNPALANKIWDTVRVLRETEYKRLVRKYYQ